uniref:Uncharacterized protein n=1 Tax=Spongospora subterranea TaxID=70186 RepID=A0A0H5R3L8_9EUKA|eukprot:CRZ08763.1 hypothetical protein [Spongospora subterranea]
MASWSFVIIMVLNIPFFTHSASSTFQISPLQILVDLNGSDAGFLVSLNQMIQDREPNSDVDASAPKDVLAHAINLRLVLGHVIEWINIANQPNEKCRIEKELADLPDWVNPHLALIHRLIEAKRNPDIYSDETWKNWRNAMRWFQGGWIQKAYVYKRDAHKMTRLDGVYQYNICLLAQNLGELTNNVINIIQEPPMASEDFQNKLFAFLLLLKFNSYTHKTYEYLPFILNSKISRFRELFDRWEYERSQFAAHKALINFARELNKLAHLYDGV